MIFNNLSKNFRSYKKYIFKKYMHTITKKEYLEIIKAEQYQKIILKKQK